MDVGNHRGFVKFCLCAILGAAAGGVQGSSYIYGEQRIELREMADMVAIYSEADDSPEKVFQFLLGTDLDVTWNDGREHDIAGWSLWEIAGYETQALLIEELVASDEAREYVFSPVYKGESGAPTIPSDAILLRWREEPAEELLVELLPTECLGEPNGEPRPFGGMEGVYLLQPRCHSGLALLDYANALAEAKETRFAEPDLIIGGRQRASPNDEHFENSWHLENTSQNSGTPGMDVRALGAWQITEGDPGVVTVLIDVGVQLDHEDIRQGTGNDFTSQASTDGGPVNKCDDHGTPVAGVVSSPINALLTVGVAPGTTTRSARTFISEVSNPCSGRWSTQFSWTVNALDWAHSEGAHISNNSNSYDQASSTIADKYAETRAAGMVHFASAGNDGQEGLNFPASLSSVNAVSAVDSAGNLADFSNHGNGLSVSAPGVGIYASDRLDGDSDGFNAAEAFAILDGTSFAAPIAAGVTALLFSRASNLEGWEAELFLQASARELGPAGLDPEFGWGMVNAEAALLLLEIFEDDLETADTSRWSRTVP